MPPRADAILGALSARASLLGLVSFCFGEGSIVTHYYHYFFALNAKKICEKKKDIPKANFYENVQKSFQDSSFFFKNITRIERI